MNNQQRPISAQQRVVRVFISSTFRDMHNEREELVKFTFPELRRKCRERAVEFVDVDLRWGIPDEQKAEGKVLPICLAEIERCRPYFIGLLGERYGWVPEKIDEELAEVQSWLKEHKEKSVTELEIIHGVLKDPAMERPAFFYFRHPEKSKQIEDELSKRPEYYREPEASHEKLRALKEQIRKSGYPVREDYPDTKTLGLLILEDLWEVIDKRFPKEEVPTALERERVEHEAFAEARRKIYIGREEYFKRLDEHVAGDGLPLVLLGESGSGKSALIANWVTKYKKEHPEEFIITHFIGSTSDSADYVRILRRIMEEIKERYEPAREGNIPSPLAGEGQGEGAIPTDPKKVVEAFPFWLAKASARGRFILVLDALNQVEDRDNALDLGWLPEYFPPNIRVILSALPGRSLEALKKRNLPAYPIQPIGEDERKKFIEEYLDQYRKKLNDAQSKRVASAGQTANPLFLRTLLEELRVFGIYEEIDNKITHYLKAEKVDDLFELVLERLEHDYDRDHSGLVRDSMSLLWASRRGLSEKELLELTGVPPAFWSPLYLAIEASLVSRSGLLNFFHDFLRKAVEDKYFYNSELKQTAHLRIADYFEKRDLDERKVDELPWQFHQAESWERLKDCVTDMDMFLKLKTDIKKYEIMGYWLSIGNRFDMVEAYNAMINRYERTSPPEDGLALRMNRVGIFLYEMGSYEPAIHMLERLLARYERIHGPEHAEVATDINNLAAIHAAAGHLAEAVTLTQRSLAIREKLLGTDDPDLAYSLNNLAVWYWELGRYEEALPIYQRALAIFERVYGRRDLKVAAVLNNIGALLEEQGKLAEALDFHKHSLAIRERLLRPDHPDIACSLNGLVGAYLAEGRYVEALPLAQRVVQIFEKAFGPDHHHTLTALNNLGRTHYLLGNHAEAHQLFHRALASCERSLGDDNPLTGKIAFNLGGVLEKQRNYAEAVALYRRALSIFERCLGPEHPVVGILFNNLAVLLDNKGDYEGAEPLYRRALAIREKALGKEHPDTALSLNNLATLLGSKGDYKGAEPLYRRALAIYEKALGKEHPDTIRTFFNLAGLLRDMGNHVNSEQLYKRVTDIYENLTRQGTIISQQLITTTAKCHNELAFHSDVPAKNWKEAEVHYRKAIELFNKIPDPVQSANSELNLQTMFHLSGQEVDLERVKRLTRILKNAGDKRAEKGQRFLKELS